MNLASIRSDIATLFGMVQALWSQPRGIAILPEVADLSSLPPSVQDNTVYYVEDIRSYFILNRSSTTTPDGITIVAAAGGGNWLRTSFAHPSWRYQTVWRVNPLTGSDVASGLPSTPLRTWAEMKRRLGGLVPLVTCDFYQEASSIDASDRLPSLAGILSQGTKLRWHGTRTVVASDIVSARVVEVPATNTPWQIQGTSITSWAQHVGRLVRITSGVNIGTVFFVDGVQPDTKARISVPCFTVDDTTPSPSTVDIGDTFEVYDLCVQYLEPIHYQFQSAGYAVPPIPSYVSYDGFYFSQWPTDIADSVITGAKGQIQFRDCAFLPNHNSFRTIVHSLGTFIIFSNCFGDQLDSVSGNLVTFFYGSWFALYAYNSFLNVLGTYFRGTSTVGSGGTIAFFSGATFGAAHNGFRATSGGIIRAYDVLFGDLNGEYGIQIDGGGMLVYENATKITVTGSLGNFSVNGLTTNIRAFDNSTGEYTAPITPTWANLVLAIGSGGFGDNAHNVALNAHLFKR